MLNMRPKCNNVREMDNSKFLTEYLDSVNPTGTEFKTVGELKDRIKQDLKWSTVSRQQRGQQCGMPATDVVGIHEGLGFRMQMWPQQRSMLKAKEIIGDIFDLYLDELLK